jgi:hypothetical protein
MNDDQMDEILIQGVRDYNAPGAVPRDEMWTQIQRTRLEKKNAAVSPVSVTEIRESRWWMRAAIGVAAAVILAVGIGIGSYVERRAPSTAATVATTTATPIAAPKSAPDGKAGAANASDTNAVGVVRKLHEATQQTDARVRDLALTNPAATESPDVALPGAATPANQSLAYRLVVLQHLAGSEAMITSFRTGARNGEMDAELKTWSRELLGTTRLLESSQASNDPVMKRLLEDLDLVISQIVQYTNKGTTNPEELDLIEQSINKRGVMSKLRSTIPSRTAPAGT